MNLSPVDRRFRGHWVFPTKTAANSERTANAAAVLAFAEPSAARISAENEMSTADNLQQKQQKQQKQREVPCGV